MTLFLRVVDGRSSPQVFRLEDSCRLRVGRRHDCDIPLQERSVSRQHCFLDVKDGRILVTDTQSRNGIWVNVSPVTDPVVVGPGTVLRLAGAQIWVQTDPGIDEDCYDGSLSVRALISLLPCRGSSRKLRLLGCAWYRHLIGYFPDDRRSRRIEVAERFADGLIGAEDMGQERNEPMARPANRDIGICEEGPNLLTTASAREAAESILCLLDFLPGIDGVTTRTLTVLARDVLGDFFHPFYPARDWLEWNDETVARIARTIYDDKDFAAMPILADALEDAGCDEQEVLRHCRGEQPHTRGCWVLDSILGTPRPRLLEPGPEGTMASHSGVAG